MSPRDLVLRLVRAGGLAAAIGVSLASFLYMLQNSVPADAPGTAHARLGLLPKPEQLSWLVGALVFVSLALTPVPRGRWWAAWALVRALPAGAALALVIDGLSATWGGAPYGFAWWAAGLPLAAALVAGAWRRPSSDPEPDEDRQMVARA